MSRTTRGELVKWFLEGTHQPNLRYMIIVCDEFDYDDYPVYVKDDEDVRERARYYDGLTMSRVMEVYDLLAPMTPQIDQDRCWAVTL